MKVNNHFIHPDLQLSSDYAPLSVTITIEEKYVDLFKFFITKNSKEEKKFIKDVLLTIKSIDILDLSDISKIEDVTNSFVSKVKLA